MAQRHDENYNEQPMTRMGRIQQPSRRYRRLRHPSFTAAIWTANNPLLQRGEFGAEIDTGKLKVGDGVTYWNDLGYVSASEIAFANITGSPDDNAALKDALDAKQDVLTAGTGIDIDSDNVISNSGVRSVASGTENGTISVNTNGTSADVAVTGLGSAAYTANSDYATAAQGAKADTAVQPGDLATVATTGAFSDLTGKPTTLSGYGITDGANTDLSNLTSTGKNIGNWSSNVSNCITEIPQDIKLDLANGTLTLKAGSKVYVPNGAGVFNQLSVTIDRTATQVTNDTRLYFYNGSYIEKFPVSACYSGTTAPSGQTYMFWYDTTNNVVKKTSDGGSTWEGGWSLPFAICSASGGAISSIDQVFNGFGYIGSTVFALPGVKGLIPTGKNTDGTLKSANLTTSSILKVDVGTGTSTDTLRLTDTILQRGAIYYIKDVNYNCTTPNYTRGNIRTVVNIGSVSYVSGKITSLSIKNTFNALDYNDSNYIANCAMPSDRYVDLTLPASDGTITAQADGSLYFNKVSSASGQRIKLNNTNGTEASVSSWSSATSQALEALLLVSKGDVIRVNYNAGGTTNYFRFIYANGSK